MLRPVLGVCAVLAMAAPAGAVPAPMSPEEMLAQADLVVDVEVASIACSGAPVREAERTIVAFVSELKVHGTIKGTPPAVLRFAGSIWEWKQGREPTGLGAVPPLPKGWRGRLYLKGDAATGYGPVWYSGIVEDAATSAPGALPSCGQRSGGRGCGGCAHGGGGSAGLLAGLMLVAPRRRRRATRAIE